MSAHLRRQTAIDAIDAIERGVARAADLETQWLDFKEEAGTRARGQRSQIDPHSEPVARALAMEVTCFANSERGGVLVVGVNDDTTGPAAFVGAHLDTVWLRKRIHELTVPRFSVDVIEELVVSGKCIYLIDVPPALEEIRVAGDLRLRVRVGGDCVELSGDMARKLLESRRRYDWSAEPSGFRYSQVEQAALKVAAEFYRTEHGRTPSSMLSLIQQLGLTTDATDNPELNNAGALLLCEFDPGHMQIDAMATRVEGVASYERVSRPAPLITAFNDVDQMLLRAFKPDHIFVGLQRREIRAVPKRTFREALVNALMHRDYRLGNGRVDVLVLGSPPTALKVRSSGGFPPGVLVDRLLTTPSRPRNPRLAQALHTLGLAEHEGIGIDTMYLEMLRDGHREPSIVEDGGDVICFLQGGDSDRSVRAFFDELAASNESIGEDVRAYIAVTLLLRSTPLRPEVLAVAAQCSHAEALETLVLLENAGVVERLVNRSQSFRLTKESRDHLRSRTSYDSRSTLDTHWQLIRAYLDSEQVISRETTTTLLGVKQAMASRILSRLHKDRGLIELAGKARGAGVRYQISSAGAPRSEGENFQTQRPKEPGTAVQRSNIG